MDTLYVRMHDEAHFFGEEKARRFGTGLVSPFSGQSRAAPGLRRSLAMLGLALSSANIGPQEEEEEEEREEADGGKSTGTAKLRCVEDSWPLVSFRPK
jgi:Pyruvate/2-oxoacid:ferredoxin oxidoreductase gamma subunit